MNMNVKMDITNFIRGKLDLCGSILLKFKYLTIFQRILEFRIANNFRQEHFRINL